MSKIALVHVNGKARTIRHGAGGTALATDGGLNYLWIEDVPAGTKVTVEPDPAAPVVAEAKPAAKVPAKVAPAKARAPAAPVVAPVEDTPATRHPSTVETSIAAAKAPAAPVVPDPLVGRSLAGPEVKTDWSRSPGGGPTPAKK